MRAEAIGRAAHALGAGRSHVGDAIDHGVGVVARVGVGDRVAVGDVLLELHHHAGRGVDAARQLCAGAVAIEDRPPASQPPVLGLVK
jgi:thymidine phosphorylase